MFLKMVEKGRGGSKTYRKGMDRERGRANLKGGNSSAFIDEYFTLNFFPPQFWENYSHFLGFTFRNSSNFLLALTFLGYLFSFFSCDNFPYLYRFSAATEAIIVHCFY